MSLRGRLTVAAGGAVFVALAIASLVIYVNVRSKLHDQVDVSLIQSAQGIIAKWAPRNEPPAPKVASAKAAAAGVPVEAFRPRSGPVVGSDASGYFQVIPNVSTVNSSVAVDAPKNAAKPSDGFAALVGLDTSVARGLAPAYFRDIRHDGVAMRLYTTPLPASRDGLVRTARPLTEANATITRVRWLLVALTLGGALAAALLGRLAATAVLRPVRALASTVREVSATHDLTRRIPVRGHDELASLAVDFNTMLAALDDSQHAQQQLIADASHELRTPLASHRANVELLARTDLPAQQRERVLGAAVRTMERLSALVGDLIQAARDGRSVDAREPVALDELVSEAVQRAEHRARELRFDSRLAPYRLIAARSRVERALDNVLDNAIKWSPPEATVEIHLDGGAVTVRDHGPGIAEADLPHVFDRFYRAASARALPGSGLGLAIVKQTVDDHGGEITVANPEGGGAQVRLRFDPNGG